MISRIKSPLGYYYKYEPNRPLGERLARRADEISSWSIGEPHFSLQVMPPQELEHIARLMRAAGAK